MPPRLPTGRCAGDRTRRRPATMPLHQLALSSADLTFSRCSSCRVGRSQLAQAGFWPLCRRPARRCRRLGRPQSILCPRLLGASSHLATMVVLLAGGHWFPCVVFCRFAAFIAWIPGLEQADCCFWASSRPNLAYRHCNWPRFGFPRGETCATPLLLP